MKFIHTGDIHLGLCPDPGMSWSRERAGAVAQSLKAVVRTAAEKQADLLLIAGDLFDAQPLPRDLKAAAGLFASIPQTKIAVCAGECDCLRVSSAALTFPFPENVHFFTEESLSSALFPEINTEVTSFSYHAPVIRENLLSGVRAPEDGRIHILMAHGGDASHVPFLPADLKSAGFTYCALAHDHRPHVLIPGMAAFCGSPEPLSFRDTGEHGCYFGEVDDVSRSLINLTFLPLSSVRCISLLVNVTPESTNTELLLDLTKRIQERGAENIYTIKIRGRRDPALHFDITNLKNRFRIAGIIDESVPDYDYPRLFAEHSSDIIGFFIRELDRPDASELEKKALSAGIDALLRTEDERS